MGALIEIEKVIEQKNGKVKVIFKYNNDLKNTVCNYYGIKRATKAKIKDFFHQAIMYGVMKHKRIINIKGDINE